MFPHKIHLRCGAAVDQAEVGDYFVDFFRGGQDLVICFETAERSINRADRARNPWSFKFLARLGYSVLGVKPKAIDWYRGEALHQWFRSDMLADFMSGFRRIIFIGSSMGGYAAAAFSRVAPGSLIIAFNPQSSLHPRLAGWDPRFREGTRQDWRGDFADAADSIALARRVYVCYDPFDLDTRHVKRLDHHNLEHLKIPFLGHPTAVWLNQLGLLKQTTESALNETLTSKTFAKWIRARRTIPQYYIALSRRLRLTGRHAAAVSAATVAVQLQPNQEDARIALRLAQQAVEQKVRVLSAEDASASWRG